MILVRSVLTRLVVYWFALARIPKSIINCLKHAIFNFLWENEGGKHKMHLVDWHTLSSPHEFGGWNIKNLELFSLSLEMKSCWLALNGKGICCQIISHKYL